MPSCFLCRRSKNAKSKFDDITFHRFPTYNPTIMKKWNAFLLANDKSLNKLTKNSVICSCHFDSSSFIYYKSRRLLSRDAVPCLTVFRVKSAKNNFPEIIQPCDPSDLSNSHAEVLTNNILLDEMEKLDDDTSDVSNTPSTSVSSKPNLPSFSVLKDINKIKTPDSMDTLSTLTKFSESYPEVKE